MLLRWILVALFAVLILSLAGAQTLADPNDGLHQSEDPEVALLEGMLTDTRHQRIYAGEVAVFLCDAATGMPIDRKTKAPFNPINATEDGELGTNRMWHAKTEKNATFKFEEVPVGEYRLVAQSWSGTEGFFGFDTNDKPSAFLVLHGVAENVEVQAGQRNLAYVRQLGKRSIHITCDPEEEHNFVLFSLKPTLTGGSLGPFGWGTEFRRNIIGITQMEVGYVTVMGLPEHEAVHAGLVNYDNSVGVGGGTFAPGQTEGTILIYAGWSNGHKDPPARLAPLTEHLAKEPTSLDHFLDEKMIEEFRHLFKDDENVHWCLLRVLMEDNERVVEVPGFGKQRLADVLAAHGFAEQKLRQAKKSRR